MNELAKRVGSPGLPQVNLLPREFAEKRQMRAVQVAALLAVLIAIGVIVAGYVLALGAKSMAQNDLESARGDQQVALAERDGKVAVHTNTLMREEQEYTLAQIGFGEIDYGQLSAAVLSTANTEASFDSIQFLGPSALGLGSPQEGFYGGGVGALTFEARTTSYADATDLIARIESVPGIAKARGTAEQYADDGGATYWGVSGSALITELRLTGRLVPEEGITGLDPTRIAGAGGEPVEPTPTPEPTPAATSTEGEG
ncbi:hypothetical protein [Demequina sp. SO4-18]|uniref:hypothetical protein n=1 Tax=Demequina sp. SO4-18 TaxID=3401026 RepID=UPI003B5A6217